MLHKQWFQTQQLTAFLETRVCSAGPPSSAEEYPAGWGKFRKSLLLFPLQWQSTQQNRVQKTGFILGHDLRSDRIHHGGGGMAGTWGIWLNSMKPLKLLEWRALHVWACLLIGQTAADHCHCGGAVVMSYIVCNHWLRKQPQQSLKECSHHCEKFRWGYITACNHMSLWRPAEGARSPGLEGTVAVASRWECRELSSGPVEEHQCSDLQSS